MRKSWQDDPFRSHPGNGGWPNSHLALALDLQRRLDAGEFADFADMARCLGFTRARISQIMDLLLIAPAIQEEILFLEVPPGAKQVAERELRTALLRSLNWDQQNRAWKQLRLSEANGGSS